MIKQLTLEEFLSIDSGPHNAMDIGMPPDGCRVLVFKSLAMGDREVDCYPSTRTRFTGLAMVLWIGNRGKMVPGMAQAPPRMELHMERLDVRLGKEMKARVAAHAASLDMSAGAYVRGLIERDMVRVDSSIEPLVFSVPMAENEETVRFTLGLTTSEKQALKRRAELVGCTQSRWIVCGIRALLTREPQPFPSEIEQLKKSNYLMATIARDVNIITRTLQSGKLPAGFDSLKGMVEILKSQVRTVDRAMQASVDRWFLR